MAGGGAVVLEKGASGDNRGSAVVERGRSTCEPEIRQIHWNYGGEVEESLVFAVFAVDGDGGGGVDVGGPIDRD